MPPSIAAATAAAAAPVTTTAATPATSATASAFESGSGPSIARSAAEVAAITRSIGIGTVGRIATHIRTAVSGRIFRRPMIVEAVPTGRRTQHPAAARIGVVPDHAAIRRHPFEVIVGIA
jgi:hypothetical protein